MKIKIKHVLNLIIFSMLIIFNILYYSKWMYLLPDKVVMTMLGIIISFITIIPIVLFISSNQELIKKFLNKTIINI